MSRVSNPLASLASRFATSRFPAWLPTVLAAIAFVGFVLAFFYELVSYQKTIAGWAKGDIDSRAYLAASNLLEPLRTQDIRAIQRIGDACEADGVHLLVTTRPGGVFYDSSSKGARDKPFYSEPCPCGEYRVSVGLPRERMLAPFRRAIRGFFLAAFVGMAGVLLFFFVTYRQHVHIRELKRLEKFRREFIADVSHEIKTPLTGILGAVELLEGCEVEVKGEEEVKVKGEGEQRIKDDSSALRLSTSTSTLVSLIGKESKRLNKLVQSILDLARLEREGDVLHLVETDPVELARGVAERYGVRFSVGAGRVNGEATSSSLVTGSTRPLLRLDPQLVEEALSNLIENAKRHSGSDDISVTVNPTRAGARACEAERELRIVVEDRGIGIPPEHAAQIFERFHRVDPSRAAETGGAGLGLAIVRRIARLHGGDVTYRPAVPHGSVFELTLRPHCL